MQPLSLKILAAKAALVVKTCFPIHDYQNYKEAHFMLRSPETVKSSLLGIVSDMAKDISSFVRNPATDFTRDRKLNFKNTVSLILSMGGQSLNSELIDYFQYVEPEIPTASALIQQSDKLLPDALSYIFHHFNAPP